MRPIVLAEFKINVSTKKELSNLFCGTSFYTNCLGQCRWLYLFRGYNNIGTILVLGDFSDRDLVLIHNACLS